MFRSVEHQFDYFRIRHCACSRCKRRGLATYRALSDPNGLVSNAIATEFSSMLLVFPPSCNSHYRVASEWSRKCWCYCTSQMHQQPLTLRLFDTYSHSWSRLCSSRSPSLRYSKSPAPASTRGSGSSLCEARLQKSAALMDPRRQGWGLSRCAWAPRMLRQSTRQWPA